MTVIRWVNFWALPVLRNWGRLAKITCWLSLPREGKRTLKLPVQTYQQPKATLFLMTDSGDVTALDANTGKTQWLSSVGTGTAPGIGLGANANYVAVVRGSTLHCLEASTGKELWAKKSKYAVGSSPAVTDEYIMVPLTDGRLELFPLKTQGLGSHALMALGEGTSQPLVTANSVSWPTMRGELNVMMRNGNARSISYRLRADDAIVSEATTDGKNLFVGSLDGFLYAIDEVRGSVNWAISLGVGISASPVPLGEFVYAISDDHKLYKVQADTGEHAEGWENPLEEIGRYVGASKENLYLLDSQGALAVVDRASKSIVNRIPVGQIDLLLNNFESDRMYIASKTGVIQCLREITSERPFFQNDEVISKTMDKMSSDGGSGSKDGSGSKQGSESKQGSSNANPFAGSGGEDPFAGSGTKDDGGEDPFGGSGTKDDGSGTKDNGSGTKDEGSGTKDDGSGTKDDGSGTKDDGSGTKGDDEDPFGGSSEDPFGGASDDEDPFG